jgi:hypothetical protein
VLRFNAEFQNVEFQNAEFQNVEFQNVDFAFVHPVVVVSFPSSRCNYNYKLQFLQLMILVVVFFLYWVSRHYLCSLQFHPPSDLLPQVDGCQLDHFWGKISLEKKQGTAGIDLGFVLFFKYCFGSPMPFFLTVHKSLKKD